MYHLCYEKPIVPTMTSEFIPYDFSVDIDELKDAMLPLAMHCPL